MWFLLNKPNYSGRHTCSVQCPGVLAQDPKNEDALISRSLSGCYARLIGWAGFYGEEIYHGLVDQKQLVVTCCRHAFAVDVARLA